jgi:hypothetical protein
LVKRKYHVALSFAGEDRDYVQRVASKLVADGVDVFYDEFEEAALWGKNLYTHLREVYEEKALFTVMFISEHYKNKMWPNHERESAQARAIESNQEYILPAFFDTSVKDPGLPKTIGHISLARKTPEEFAALIVKKLQHSGVELSSHFAYSDEAKADVDFPHPQGTKVSAILNDLKSHTWPTQSPAVEAIFALDWKSLDKNEIFVLGRNIYQCACGSEWKAMAVVSNLREKLAGLPERAAAHFLNGMLYEVYFDKEGQFRASNLKGERLGELLEVQKVKRFEPSISFIRHALEPYKSRLLFLPSTTPEIVTLSLSVKLSDPPEVKSVKFKGTELLKRVDEDADLPRHAWKLWKLAHVKFTVKQLKEMVAEAWSVPVGQLEIKSPQKMEPHTQYRLPKGFSLVWPEQGT